MKNYWIYFLVGITLCASACEKAGVSIFQHIPYPTPDSASDVRSMLDSSSFTLFKQAAKRIGLDSLLPTTGYFTILAPVDSAMQSAGLTASGIASMPVDTLRRIVLYHVAVGPYSPASLVAASVNIESNSLQVDAIYDDQNGNISLFPQVLFLKITGVLYINGEPENGASDTAITASNGYIYPIRTVLQPPQQTVWQAIEGRPELSLFLAAMRLRDSIYYWNGLTSQYSGLLWDSALLNMVIYSNQPNYTRSHILPTVFAPTNAAFAAAGFPTVDDLRAYAVNYTTIGGYPYNYLPIDTLVSSQMIGNNNYSFVNINLYNDLLFNPAINNGSFNVFAPGGNFTYYQGPFPLQFHDNNNVVTIQWSDSSTISPAVLPADPGGHFFTQNGVVYEIGTLFYPHN